MTAAKTISVLLVEDSVMDGRLLIEAIRSAMTAGEVVVQSVKTLAAAKSELEKFSFSCVLLDLGLPDGRGTGNVSALREIDKNAAIVVLTGLDDDRSATESLKLGAQDYLIKGETDGDKLMKLIRRAVQRNRQTVALETRRDSTFFDASRDPLTLLPNRSLFFDRARTQLSGTRLSDAPFGVLCLVVEGVNEARSRYGAGVADELLQKLAQVMAESLRVSDTLARVEYGEFGVLLQPFGSHEDLSAKAALLSEHIKAIRMVGNCPVELLAKSGIAVRSHEETIEELFDEARTACDHSPVRAAAASGEELVVEIPAVQAVPDVSLAGLRFVPRWQPWADVVTARWLGLEFLPEWPDGKPLFGSHAISMTEALEVTLSAADALAAQWRIWRGGAFTPSLVALNVPAAALRHADFAHRLRQVLEAHNLPPAQVQLEIEESAFKDGGSYVESLNQLHGGGYVLCMDGDGSADISLREFVRSPVNSYKLSRRFLQTLVEEGLQGPSRRFLTAMHGASQALGSSIIASGVDSIESRGTLQLVGVQAMQGDALSPALAPEFVPPLWDQPPALQ